MPFHDRPKLGISACLLGQNVWYNGRHKLSKYLRDNFGRYVEWLPVCPETECGLGVPREKLHLTGSSESPRLLTKSHRRDVTQKLNRWTESWLKHHHQAGLHGFIVKSRSPTCGFHGVQIKGDTSSQTLGLFSRNLHRFFKHLPIEEEKGLEHPETRENFIQRIFLYKEWSELNKNGRSVEDLKAFQLDQELLLLAYSGKHLKKIDELLKKSDTIPLEELYSQYIEIFMEGLSRKSTITKQLNVFRTIERSFKKELTEIDRKELFNAAWRYHRGEIPLIVPLTLLRHFSLKYDVSRMKQQSYLNPHPLELMLRNRV